VRPGRVLVISGDAPVLTMVTNVLRAQGYDVQPLATVDLKAVDSYVADVLVVDTSRLSSTDVSALHTIDRPLIVIASLPGGASTALRLGARSFWPVPFDVDLFVRAVRGACWADLSVAKPHLVYAHPERRAATRPKLGDVKPCPHCRAAMRFVELAETGAAWVCRNPDCMVVTVVRASP
jgi:DNA-binding NtrC family response regulator